MWWVDGVGLGVRTCPAGVEGRHVEDVDALHLSQDFEALQPGGLFEVGGDGAGRSAGGHEVVFVFDFCVALSVPLPSLLSLQSSCRTGEGCDEFALFAWLGVAFGGFDWEYVSMAFPLLVGPRCYWGRTASGGDGEGAPDCGSEDCSPHESRGGSSHEHRWLHGCN